MLSKEYQNTTQTLRHIAQNMADQARADRLEAADKDYERRAQKPFRSDKASAVSTVRDVGAVSGRHRSTRTIR